METNKFATLLHKNTHKITVVLIYTFLEWILIALLLLNGLFSYIISKFASYFGLKPPCVLCSRVDHLFESDSSLTSYRRHLCDSHKIEVSQLGFCSLHKRLAEAGDMCEDCGTSRPAPGGGGAVLSWMRRSEMGEKDLKCSCCRIALESGFYSPYVVMKPNWGVLEYTHKVDLDKDAIFEIEEGKLVSFDVFDSVDQRERERGSKETFEDRKDEIIGEGFEDTVFEVDEDRNLIPNFEEKPLIELHDSIPIVINEYLDITARDLVQENENPRLVPLELIDSTTITMVKTKICDSNMVGDEERDIGSDNGLTDRDLNPLDIGDVLEEEKKMVSIVEQNSSRASEENGFEEENKTEDLSISIGSEIPEQEEHSNVDPEIIVDPQHFDNNLVSLVDLSSPTHHDDFLHDTFENNGSEDEKPPETPTRLIRSERGLESLDGSDTESTEPLTIDHLKSALQSERIALRGIYLELEEERSASAISTNESMAMINRLQEEKAAMQMEALQYQRMMEEQSEYDQEALHLLNELVVKREREKQEVERELEGYKRKFRVLERKISRSNEGSKNGLENSSSFSSNSSSSLGLLEENGIYENTPIDEEEDERDDLQMVSIDETLDEFEEERISILEQLKGLEEKLFDLDHEENENGDKLNENDNHINEDYESFEDILHLPSSNGSFKHESRCKSVHKGKRLLPLFDAVSFENGEDNGEGNGENREERLAMREEVGEVYDRLQALEADREFLRHCIKSLKKGDAGLDLLQEILQHLRDLKRVELRVRNSGDGVGPLTV